MDQQPDILKFTADENTRDHLRGIALFAGINAILAFASLLFSVISIFILAAKYGTDITSAGQSLGRQLVSWIITIFLNIMLLNSANALKKAVLLDSQAELNKGLGLMARYFKTLGILIIVAVALIILVILFFLTIGYSRY